MTASLRRAEAMIDILDSEEQLQLLQYLVPKLRIAAPNREHAAENDAAIWERIKELGKQIASEPGTGQSALSALDEMRR
jgi:hypothetical protein